MRIRIGLVGFAIFFAQIHGNDILAQAAPKKEKDAAFDFAAVKYFHRFTLDDQHEYTPRGQEDLNSWADMVTVNYYRKVKDGEALAATANAVLEKHKEFKALVIRTNSVPKTKEKPAEYLTVVLFPRPEFMEAVFARFRIGCSCCPNIAI